MKNLNKLFKIAAALFLLPACCGTQPRIPTTRILEVARTQFIAMDARLSPDEMPRTFENGKPVDSHLDYWCSGFFPGSLWYLYGLTGDEDIRRLAEKNTRKLNDICVLNTSHDIGFQVMCSFGNEYRMTGDTSVFPVMRSAAAKLARRFSPVVGCTLSWDKCFHFPVIIDNMMNLELLMEASRLFACDSLRQIACTHANTTMANHFRPDGSSFHLVDYDPETGSVIRKRTVQGFADATAWARGQAWGLYGYTVMYEKSGDKRYLEQAERIAGYILPRLPKDGIPYWDFNAPGTPDAVGSDAEGHPAAYSWKEGDKVLRDASAGAIMASALISLSGDTPDRKRAKQYLKVARRQIATLSSQEYLAEPGTNGGFLLKHSVGNLHNNVEVDVPLTYADYYFLESLWKLSRIVI